jgi:hypothetical protein
MQTFGGLLTETFQLGPKRLELADSARYANGNSRPTPALGDFLAD